PWRSVPSAPVSASVTPSAGQAPAHVVGYRLPQPAGQPGAVQGPAGQVGDGGRGPPYARVGQAAPGRGLPGARDRGGQIPGGTGGGVVGEQGGEHRDRGEPPVGRLRVQVADLQVAPRPHRGEQGAQVVVEVVDGGRGADDA